MDRVIYLIAGIAIGQAAGAETVTKEALFTLAAMVLMIGIELLRRSGWFSRLMPKPKLQKWEVDQTDFDFVQPK